MCATPIPPQEKSKVELLFFPCGFPYPPTPLPTLINCGKINTNNIRDFVYSPSATPPPLPKSTFIELISIKKSFFNMFSKYCFALAINGLSQKY